MPPNYQNGKVYKICSHSTDKVYIGSTTQLLCSRLSGHVRHFKINCYVSSSEIIGLGDYYIELLCDYPCERKEQLCAKEGEYIRQYKDKCVNKCIAGRTKQEYNEENKEIRAEKHKQYRENNKEQIAQKEKVKFTCECGKTSTIGHKLRHERSMKHINFINSSN